MQYLRFAYAASELNLRFFLCQHPLACFSFAFKNLPKGVGRFFLESLQRPKNEIATLYAITFLPPGMFLYFHLNLLFIKINSNKTSTANLSFSIN